MFKYIITKHDMEELQHMRNIRSECVFKIINRGRFWYESLTEKQLEELRVWYQEWLDFTKTGSIPLPLDWLEVQYEIGEDLK
jgi:hypothetical protein